MVNYQAGWSAHSSRHKDHVYVKERDRYPASPPIIVLCVLSLLYVRVVNITGYTQNRK